MRSALNLIHYSTGQREINFTKKEILQKLYQFLKKSFGNIPLEDSADLFLSVNTNLGIQHYSFPVGSMSINNSIDIVMSLQEKRLLVCNQRTRITRERFEVLLPQCGLFSHIYQAKGLFRSKEKFNVNCYVLLHQEYFAGCVIKTPSDLMELYDEYPSWDKGLLGASVANNESHVILAIRPWELLILKHDKLIFL